MSSTVYNFTQTNTEYRRSKVTQVFLATYFITLITLGVLLNSLLLIVVKIKSALHKPSYLLLCSIAASNVMCCVMLLPTIVVTIIHPSFKLNAAACEVQASIMQIWWVSNIYSIMFFCYDRCKSISHPLVYRSTMTNKKTISFIAFTWIFATIMGWLPIFGLGSYKYSADKCVCDKNWTEDRYINIGYTVLSFWFPFLSIVTCNLIIMSHARNNITGIKQLQAISSRSSEIKLRKKSLFKIVKTSMVIIGTILLTWFPHLIVIYVSSLTSRNYVLVLANKSTLHILFLPILIYPYLFGIRNETIKRNLKILFKRMRCGCSDIRKIHPAVEIDENDYSENVSRRNSRSETINGCDLKKNSLISSSLFILVKNRRDSTGSTNLTPVDM